MALIPHILSDLCFQRPSLIIPQQRQFNPSSWNDYIREMEHQLSEVEKDLSCFLINKDNDLSIQVDPDKFQANVDVQQFRPEEISVKLTGDNSITVEGKHEEKQDEHGYISRHFVRRYVLSENCDVRGLQSKLSSDGVLTITAPKKTEGKELDYKLIPIQRTGKPLRKIEEKPKDEAKKVEST